MDIFFIYYTVGLALIIGVPFYRVIKGPTVFDRLLGANAIGTSTIVLILLLGVLIDRIELFVDIALAYAILNFIGTLIISKYFSTDKAKQ